MTTIENNNNNNTIDDDVVAIIDGKVYKNIVKEDQGIQLDGKKMVNTLQDTLMMKEEQNIIKNTKNQKYVSSVERNFK